MSIFKTLSNGRQNSGFGPCPISLNDIMSYLQMKNLIMDLNSTIDILQAMDKTYIEFFNKDD